MADEEDNRIKSTRTWIKWNNLEDGTSMKYGDKLFTKPEQCEQLKIELKRRMKNNDAAKRKRSEHTAPKKSRVKYDDAIGKVNMNNTWIKWTELKPGETMKYRGREFHKDVPDDQEKLMTRIINRMNSYDKEKDQNNNKKAAGALMVMMSGNRGEQNNDKEAWNQIDDDNNCEAVANTTNKNNEHDRNCVVEANTGDNEGVDINDEGGKEVDNEFDIDSLYNHEYDYADIDGTADGTDNGMIASEHDCDDDRKRESNREIKDYNDNYNKDDGGGECC
jgi:hypothetical protein